MARWFSWLRRSSTLALLAGIAALAVVTALGVAVPRWRARDAVLEPQPDRPLPGTPLGDDRSVGAGLSHGNLTVFPIYAREPRDVGDFTTLDAAIAKGEAEVRELGSDPAPSPSASSDAPPDPHVARDAAQVGKLEIENKGKAEIMVLAGTILKGGKQDRQVGEDVVVAPGKTVQVASFCVERGRWNGTREGVATDGKFSVEKTLASGKIRAAGQYEGNQGEVWNKVAEMNAANAKEAASGTLLATVGDSDLAAAREALVEKVLKAFESAEQQDRIVGLAYAVDGTVRGVRWFAGKKLLALHLGTLLRTAALEALTAQAEARAAGREVSTVAAPATAATQLVEQMEKEAVAEKHAADGSTKSYKKGKGGYASELVIEGSTARPGSPKAAPTSVTKDFVNK